MFDLTGTDEEIEAECNVLNVLFAAPEEWIAWPLVIPPQAFQLQFNAAAYFAAISAIIAGKKPDPRHIWDDIKSIPHADDFGLDQLDEYSREEPEKCRFMADVSLMMDRYQRYVGELTALSASTAH